MHVLFVAIFIQLVLVLIDFETLFDIKYITLILTVKRHQNIRFILPCKLVFLHGCFRSVYISSTKLIKCYILIQTSSKHSQHLISMVSKRTSSIWNNNNIIMYIFFIGTWCRKWSFSFLCFEVVCTHALTILNDKTPKLSFIQCQFVNLSTIYTIPSSVIEYYSFKHSILAQFYLKKILPFINWNKRHNQMRRWFDNATYLSCQLQQCTACMLEVLVFSKSKTWLKTYLCQNFLRCANETSPLW